MNHIRKLIARPAKKIIKAVAPGFSFVQFTISEIFIFLGLTNDYKVLFIMQIVMIYRKV
jgi:hypothetical protein